MTVVDITYMINRDERYGRRRMYNNHTGETWWDPPEPVKSTGPVEPLPPASADSLPADPAPPVTKSVAKRVKAQAKRLLHG